MQELEQFLGIDVGGTNVKMGTVDLSGNIEDFQSYPTADWRSSEKFTNKFLDAISYKLLKNKSIKKIGIGIPGLLSSDRRSVLEVPAIPELNGVRLVNLLKKQFPTVTVSMENDANAAALGEFYFGSEEMGEDFIFATLGTGIGGAAVVNKRLFNGAGGNAMEFGHIVSRGGYRLEQNIGKRGILNMAAANYPKFKKAKKTKLTDEEVGSASRLIVAAEENDALALHVFHQVGILLGEGLVAGIRILDCKSLLIGGGLSASFEYIYPGLMETLNSYLTPYYLEELSIKRATLGNDAGILGAASLCFVDER